MFARVLRRNPKKVVGEMRKWHLKSIKKVCHNFLFLRCVIWQTMNRRKEYFRKVVLRPSSTFSIFFGRSFSLPNIFFFIILWKQTRTADRRARCPDQKWLDADLGHCFLFRYFYTELSVVYWTGTGRISLKTRKSLITFNRVNPPLIWYSQHWLVLDTKQGQLLHTVLGMRTKATMELDD